MVKQVVIEETDLNYLRQLSAQCCTAGLIVGRVTPSKDYIARIIKCPTQILGDNVKDWNSVKDVDGSWIAGHAGQVMPSLPGGVSVIGLFMKANSAESKLAMEKLKHALYQTYKIVSKTSGEIENFLGGSVSDDDSLFWTIFHSDLRSGNIFNCKQYDMKDNKDPGRPVEIKQTEAPIQWDCLETAIHIDDFFMLPEAKSKEKVFASLSPYCNRIALAHVLLDGNHRPGTEILNQSTSSQSLKGGKKRKPPASSKSVAAQIHCEIFLPFSGDHCHNVSYKPAMIHLSGTISAKAFLSPGVTISQSIHALKYDIIQSIQQRCSILSEDMGDMCQSEDLLKSLPRRVYVVNQGGILFSEYVLPNEPLEDCLERLQDNLDISGESDQLLETNCQERVQSSLCKSTLTSTDDVAGNVKPRNEAPRTNAIVAVLATAIAALAWMFSGIFVSEN